MLLWMAALTLGVSARAQTPKLAAIAVSSDSVALTLDARVKTKDALYPDPPRVVVDLLGAKLAAIAPEAKPQGLILKGVRAAQQPAGARVVLDLNEPAAYELVWDSATLSVRVHEKRLKPEPQAVKIVKTLPKIAPPQAKPVSGEKGGIEARVTLSSAGAPAPDASYSARFSLVDLDDKEVWVETVTAPATGGALAAWIGRQTPLPADLDPALRLTVAPLDRGLSARMGLVTLKIGSFAEEKRARELEKELAETFSQISVAPISSAGRRLYQVRVGPLESGLQAEIVRRKLRTLGYQAAISAP